MRIEKLKINFRKSGSALIMLLSLGIASANFFAKLMLDDWLLTMDNMGMKTRVLRAPC